MDIVIFKDLTSDEYLTELEESAKKYDGLYVDMEDAPQRKFVKEKAYDIQQLIKKVDRKRIDESKTYKAKVEAEAAKIKERLESANAPFTFLIERHKKERAKILAAEKAEREAEELLIQIEIDHDDAIQLNKLFDLEALEKEREQEALREQLRKEGEQRAKEEANRLAAEQEQRLISEKAAAEQAKIDAENALIAQKKQAKIDADIAERKRLSDIEEAVKAREAKAEAERLAKEIAEQKRKANIEHVTAISKASKESLMQFCGLDNDTAVNVVKAIRSGKIAFTELKL